MQDPQEHNLSVATWSVNSRERISTAVQEIVLHERLSKENEMDSRGYSKLNIIVYARLIMPRGRRGTIFCALRALHNAHTRLPAACGRVWFKYLCFVSGIIEYKIKQCGFCAHLPLADAGSSCLYTPSGKVKMDGLNLIVVSGP
jgi:hypothetical protein